MSEATIAWIVINIAGSFLLLIMLTGGMHIKDMYLANPLGVYDNIKVNWFGAWFISIVFNVLLPCFTVPYWIYKIFTVGRK